MANPNSTLLTAEERRSLYSAPVLNDIERTEYFTFTDDEIKILNGFDHIENSVYFEISLDMTIVINDALSDVVIFMKDYL